MVNFYTLLRLLAAALLGVVIANRAFAQDNPWPKPEQWVGKKPSEIIHTPGRYGEPEDIDFYDLFSYRSSPLWGGLHFESFKVEDVEQPIQQIGRYLVFMAYDCSDKVCQEGFAFIYNVDTQRQVLCLVKRQEDDREELLDPDGFLEEIGEDKDTYYHLDELEIRTVAAYQGHLERDPPAYILKIGHGLSCGGLQKDASNYQAVLDQLLLAEKLLP